MSNDIKPGDLVMMVNNTVCCNARPRNIFEPFVAGPYGQGDGIRCQCGAALMYRDHGNAVGAFGGFALVSMLKKIDPPAEGDSLPTRRDLEVPA